MMNKSISEISMNVNIDNGIKNQTITGNDDWKRSSIQNIMNDADNAYLENCQYYGNSHADYDEMTEYIDDLTDVISDDELSILNDIHADNINLLTYYVSMFTLKKKINIHALTLTMKAMLRMYHANPGLFKNIHGIEDRKKKPYYLNIDDYDDMLSSFYNLYNYDDYINMMSKHDDDTSIHVDYVMFMKHNDYIMKKHPDKKHDYSFNTVIKPSFTDAVNLDAVITEYYSNHVSNNVRIMSSTDNDVVSSGSRELTGNDYEYHYSDVNGGEHVVPHVNGTVYIDYMLSMYEDTLDYNILIVFHRNSLNSMYMNEITDYLMQSYAYYLFLSTIGSMNSEYHNGLHGYDWGLLAWDDDVFYVDFSLNTPVAIRNLTYAYEHIYDVDDWNEERINDAMSVLESYLRELLDDIHRDNLYDLNVDNIYYEFDYYEDEGMTDAIILLMRLTTDLCQIQDFLPHDKLKTSYGYTLLNEPDAWYQYTYDCIINGYTIEYMIENLKIKYYNNTLNSDYGY